MKSITSLIKNITKRIQKIADIICDNLRIGKLLLLKKVSRKVQKLTLVLSHNKTLVGQLYSELKELFPKLIMRIKFIL
ncbi:MAG: hypothetical protein IJB82_03715 [Bacilli bacterium]|nr:hypothetical protein [Bacilli bacterium]